jgi:16S rRNA (cytosine967-C5)-methyltransferase
MRRAAAGRRSWERRRAPSARELALQILTAAESRHAYSDRLLESRLKHAALSSEDSHLVTTLVQGVLRARATLDHHLAAFTEERWPLLPLAIRTALRLGAFQILLLDRIPHSAAVDESVELAKRYGHPGTAGLVNAVLRRLARGDRAPLPDAAADPIAHLAAATSHPAWIVERWVARFGVEEATRLLEADNAEPRVSVRANGLRTTTQALAAALHAEGFDARPGPNGGGVLVLGRGFVAARASLFRDGSLSLQDEAEAAVVPLLDARPGETAVDLCAAPGGKASQIAEAVGPGGRVLALEHHLSRARALRENLLGRLRLPNALVACADGRRPPLKGGFARVLVDAPCSGLGVLNRRADARWRKDATSITSMATLQSALLEGAGPLVRAGGALVYSVCSLEPEETDQIVEGFLAAHPEFALDDARPLLPPGFRGEGPAFRAFPHRHGTDGVFAARLTRR